MEKSGDRKMFAGESMNPQSWLETVEQLKLGADIIYEKIHPIWQQALKHDTSYDEDKFRHILYSYYLSIGPAF